MLDSSRRQNSQAAEDEEVVASFDVVSSFPKAEEIDPRDWVYGRHSLMRAVSATIGDGGIGKSILLLTEAIAIVTGRPLLGIQPKPINVFYWSGEEPIEEINRRVAAICQHFGVDTAELENRLFVATMVDFPLDESTGYEDADLGGGTKGMTRLAQFIHDHEIYFVIIDPFVACHCVAENDNMAIDHVVKTWFKFARQEVASVELVHHTRKPPFGGAAEASVDDARGASAFKDAVRSARALNRMTEAEGQRAGVENHRFYFRAENGKANYARPPEEASWFKMIPILLANGDQYNPADEVGIVVPWRYPKAFDGITTAHMEKVRTMAAEGAYRTSAQSPDWIGNAVAEVLNLDVEDDNDRARIKALLKTWFKNGVLRKVERKDENRNMRPFVGPGEWSET